MIARLRRWLGLTPDAPVSWWCDLCEVGAHGLTRAQALHEVRAHALLIHTEAPAGVDPL